MARVFDTRVRQHVEEVIVERTCDHCGARTEHQWRDPEDKATQRPSVSITICKHKVSLYPGDDSYTEEFDLCPSCWEEHLVPLLFPDSPPTRTEHDL